MKTALPSRAIGLGLLIAAARAITADASDRIDPCFGLAPAETALPVTDPQNDFLRPDDVARGVAAATRRAGLPVPVSPRDDFQHEFSA